MVSLTQLAYIVEVLKLGSFQAAAKACHVTQPTLSMQIQKMESILDVIIFDRSSHPIQATTMGTKIIEQARRVLFEYKQIEDMLNKEAKQLSGPFSLAVIPTLAPYLLPLFLEKFLQACPLVELEIKEMQTHQIIAALRTGQLDAGLLVTPLNDTSLHEEHLFFEPFFLYTHTRENLAKNSKISEEHLDADKILLLSEGHCMREQMIKVCQLRSQQKKSEKKFRFESGSIETLMNIVERNGGYTIIPYLATAKDYQVVNTNKDGHLNTKIIAFKAPTPAREVSLVWSQALTKRAISKELKNTIMSAMPKELIAYQKNRQIERIDI